MMETAPDDNPRPARSSLVPAVLTVVSLGILTLLVVTLIFNKTPQDSYSDQNLNISKIDVGATFPTEALNSAQEDTSPSGLTMIRRGNLAPISTASGPQKGSAAHARNLTQAIRACESRYEALGMRYTRKYPLIQQYGRDWMSYPDLKRFNDEYFQNHDPIKFAWNVASSPNFAKLVVKYAHKPEITTFIQDAIKEAPGELLSATRDYFKTEDRAVKLLDRFATQLGLPAGLMAGLSGGQMNAEQATTHILNSNPQLQNLLQQNQASPDQFDRR